MRILIFTLLLSLLSFVLKAQEWNISSEAFNALGSIEETTTVEGLTIYADSTKPVVIEANNKTVGDLTLTHRMKLGGAGTVTDSLVSSRVVSFEVAGNATITVAAMSSKTEEDRELVILAGSDTLAVFPALGAELTMADYEYTGEATTIYMFSKSSGINIYYLKSVAAEEPPVIDWVQNSTDEYAIFDPAAYNPALLKEGMEIVEINGKKMLQVVVNEWGAILDVPEFAFDPSMTAFTEFKYVVAQEEYTAAQITAGVQLIDTVNLMKPSWSDTYVSTTTGVTKSNPSGEFTKAQANAAPTMKVVHQVQFFGQQNVNWGAVTGDTIWIGKVRAYKVDPNTIFDPVTYDPDNFADGMELVEVGGKKMLQVVVNDWNSIVEVPEFTFKEGVKAFAEFKYVVAQEEYTAAQINATVQLIDTVNLMKPSWSNDSVASTTGIVQSNPNGEFFKGSASISATMKVAHQVQFFGQQNVNWGAVIGDTMWVGAVRAYEVDPNVIVDPATVDLSILNTGWEVVDISGTKYFKVALNGWDSWTNIPEYTFPEGTTGFKATVKYEQGSANYTVDQVNTFLKLSTPGWTEIAAAGSPSSAEFKEYVVNIADLSIGNAGVFQVAGQETSGWSTVVGAYLYISKVEIVKAPETAAVTFIIDDSAGKTYDGFMLKGSWSSTTGEYDVAWDGGAEHTAFYDDGTNGDAVAGDNIWSVTLNLVPDAGANTWEWGFNDLTGTWIPKGNTQFKVESTSPVTTTYDIKVGVDDFSNANMKLYPNPTTGIINLSGIVAKSVDVYNMYGSKVLSVQVASNSIDVSGLSNGAYLMKVIDSNGDSSITKFNKK